MDLASVIDIGDIPRTRVYYELEVSGPSLEELLTPIIATVQGRLQPQRKIEDVPR